MKNHWNGIGIMSGTSLDGLDVVNCSFSKIKGSWSFQIHYGKTYPFTEELKTMLETLPRASAYDLAKADVDFGRFIGETIIQFVDETGVVSEFIASHGYTVFHEPQSGITTQIGSGAQIAGITGIKTINDFRTLDVALGGQGAPLVPIGDELLFEDYDACLNLGGFSNISYKANNQRVAFDICPVNYLLNHFSQLTGKPFDEGGQLGQQGKIDELLLKMLNNLPFYNQKPPKSMGREFVENSIFPLVNAREFNTDVLRTLYEHITEQLAVVINSQRLKNVLITGGGAYNTFLLHLLKQKTNAELIVPEKDIIDFKEALIFAFMGLLRILDQNNGLASVTGARTDSSGGSIYG